MHEYLLAKSLVHTIDNIAVEQGALGVVGAQVRLGKLAFMSERSLREQFARAAKGTRVEGAQLTVHVSPDAAVSGEEGYEHEGEQGGHHEDHEHLADEEYYGLTGGIVLETVELRMELHAAL